MPRNNKQTLVTKPSLPDLKELIPYLEDIWESRWLTNNGKYHQQLEEEMANYLGVKYISLFTNGTLSLLVAIKALELNGEVITTPYSFIATSHSLLWNNIKPVFVDVEPKTGNMDPQRIEEAITPNTTAILPVHVYGNPCNVEIIEEIARKHNLRVIYDAAHTFGNQYKGHPILNWGDLSILSFHATKPFNTMEGGAIISHDLQTKNKIDYLKNFGFENETNVASLGINSKMNEFQAALGLLQLKDYDKQIDKRRNIAHVYRKGLRTIDGIKLLELDKYLTKYNFPYFPIFIDESEYGLSRDELYEKLKTENIYGRRYFYPLISNFNNYKQFPSSRPDNLPIANMLSKQVLCLPLFSDLSISIVNNILDLLQK